MQPKPKILGRLLVEDANVPSEAVDAALEEQRKTGRRLGEVLIERGSVDEDTVARCLALQLGLAHAATPLRFDPDAAGLISPTMARERRVLPLRTDGRSLSLGMADPLDLETVDDIQFRTGRRVEPVVVSQSAVAQGHALAYGSEPGSAGQSPDGVVPAASQRALEEAARAAPVVRLVDGLLHRAVAERASDVHIEHTGDAVHVRFRVDGVLRSVARLPTSNHSAVVSRIKIMAGMDIAVKRRPQDGGLTFRSGGTELTLRVSTLPASSGEKVVARLLDAGEAPAGLDDMGLAPSDLSALRRLVAQGEGVILAAGPTGSGKSTTLFGALGEVDRGRLNVVTLEDPVEYRLDGASQVQVRPPAGLTFPAALRSVLRQDPDVIMVGEIRDRETAEIAMAAAVTGHLVLSTIHTIDAPGAVTRLLHMGVPPFLVAGGLSGVVAQRLVRRLCRHCRGREAERCDRCADGYDGRTGVFQVLIMDDALREEVVGGASAIAMRRLARAGGMSLMAEDALRKVAEGVTAPHEVSRVVMGEPGAGRPCGRCGGGVPPGALGCPACGCRLRRECACGRPLRAPWRFCPWCLRPARS